MLLDGEIGVLRDQLAALGEDFHNGARKEIDLIVVVDQAKQGTEAIGVGRYTGAFQNLVVGPADPLSRFRLPQIGQGIDDLVELLPGISVKKERRSPSRPRNSGMGTDSRDDSSVLEVELVEIELDGLDAKGSAGVGQGQFLQLLLLPCIGIGLAATGYLDSQNLCLCQQRQAQTQFDELFHSLFSCRVRDVPGV